jgi:DNA repair photolyase
MTAFFRNIFSEINRVNDKRNTTMTEKTTISRNFWRPSVTSQFCVCPIPFHFDTYRGCSYGCLFCFARDFIEFSRRNQDADKRS